MILDRAVEALAAAIARRLLYTPVIHGDPSKVHADPTAVLNDALLNVSSGEITIGQHAFLGHRVSILTGTHDIEKFGAERQTAIPRSGRDVVIGAGAWVGSNATVIGPCRIGEHAVVGACSLVNEDVEPYTVVAGIPAKPLRTLPH